MFKRVYILEAETHTFACYSTAFKSFHSLYRDMKNIHKIPLLEKIHFCFMTLFSQRWLATFLRFASIFLISSGNSALLCAQYTSTGALRLAPNHCAKEKSCEIQCLS